jgi:hypothetical protein
LKYSIYHSLVTLTLLSLSFLLGGGKSICGPLFPRVLGGDTGDTEVRVMDYHIPYTVLGGFT